MANLGMGGFSVQDGEQSGQVNIGMALVGAVGGALALGVVYGLVGRFVGEFAYAAFLIGAASGVAAMKLGGGRSFLVGGVAAGVSLIAVVGAKLIVGAPEGTSWVAYHTTMFDILFCYLLNPAAAFFTAGTDQVRGLLKRFM
jgi:hypothetical protein